MGQQEPSMQNGLQDMEQVDAIKAILSPPCHGCPFCQLISSVTHRTMLQLNYLVSAWQREWLEIWH